VGDAGGWSVVVDPLAYSWRNPRWMGRPWEETVLYELHAGLFGGFKGVADALPALKDLGITAVELMPVASFPGARNWGYDGVLPYAPDEAYGSPDDLKSLVDRAHDLGLMIFLDVVYNHFGPDGNYLPLYAPEFFRNDRQTPWGGAIDFRRPAVRRFFADNALCWLMEYRFDGLRFDAVHAIAEPGWLDDLAAEIRTAVEPGRHVHLVLENEDNGAGHLARGFNAQWNDDIHNVLHVLLTGETGGYYADFAADPAGKLARALREGFVYQGEASAVHDGQPRGEPSGALPPSAFVGFLQNHDQIGNRALGERLTVLAQPDALKAAVSLLLLSPQIPMIFMGEETGSRTPFFYFTDHGPELAEAVREGRRREFAAFPAFSRAEAREAIPDPNAKDTFERSRPEPGGEDWPQLYRQLLRLRHDMIVPGIRNARSVEAHALSERAVIASWRMGDGALLTLAVNLGEVPVRLATPMDGDCFFGVGVTPSAGVLAGQSFAAWREPGP
jgi:maltooligosyltrehalose trehalohydrolase